MVFDTPPWPHWPFWFSRCGHPPPSTLQQSRFVAEESSTLPSISRRRIRSPWSSHPSPREFKRWMVEAGTSGGSNIEKKHTGYIDLYTRYIIKEILPQMAFIFEFRNLKFWGDYNEKIHHSKLWRTGAQSHQSHCGAPRLLSLEGHQIFENSQLSNEKKPWLFGLKRGLYYPGI